MRRTPHVAGTIYRLHDRISGHDGPAAGVCARGYPRTPPSLVASPTPWIGVARKSRVVRVAYCMTLRVEMWVGCRMHGAPLPRGTARTRRVRGIVDYWSFVGLALRLLAVELSVVFVL